MPRHRQPGRLLHEDSLLETWGVLQSTCPPLRTLLVLARWCHTMCASTDLHCQKRRW